MKNRFVLIAALLTGLLFGTTSRAQETPKETAPQTQQAPVEKKLQFVVTTAGVEQDAKLALALADAIVKDAKVSTAIETTVATAGNPVAIDAEQTVNLRLVGIVDPDDATKNLVSFILVVHEKGNFFSFYLGSGTFKVDANMPPEEVASQILGYVSEAFSAYEDTVDTAATKQ